MIPYASIISYAALGLACAWGGWSVQSWRLGEQIQSLKTEYATAQARAVERAHSETIRLQAQADKAAKQSAARQAKMADDARRSDVAIGLLHDAAATAISAAQTSYETCQRVAATSTDLLQSCSREYRSVAAEADKWVNRALTLDDAWPTTAPQSVPQSHGNTPIATN